MAIVESLDVQISVSAERATKAIRHLTKSVGTLATSLKFDTSNLEKLGKINGDNLKKIGEGFQAFSSAAKNIQNIDCANFNKMATALEKITNIDSSKLQALGKLEAAGNSIKRFTEILSSAEKVQQNTISITSAIAKLANAGDNIVTVTTSLPLLGEKLKEFIQTMSSVEKVEMETISFMQAIGTLANAGKKAETTANSLTKLGEELKKFMQIMSTAPTISQSIIQMTWALTQLASQESRVDISAERLNSNISKVSSTMGKLRTNVKKATADFKSLARQILAAAGIYVSIYGAVRGFAKAIKSSMDYVEDLNYFNAAFGQIAENADLSSWKEAGYNSAQAYYDSFAKRAEEITQKMTGYQVSESGMLLSTGAKNLGIDPSQLMNYQAVFGQMSSSMGVTSENALLLSDVLTKIGADLASVKNMDFDKVWNDMSSGLAGMSRTLDKYGVNIRNVNLQQKLNELGIDANITALNQNEKALLRTIILLDTTRYAWADMADTIDNSNKLLLVA